MIPNNHHFHRLIVSIVAVNVTSSMAGAAASQKDAIVPIANGRSAAFTPPHRSRALRSTIRPSRSGDEAA
jgi:hypothetical protein